MHAALGGDAVDERANSSPKEAPPPRPSGTAVVGKFSTSAAPPRGSPNLVGTLGTPGGPCARGVGGGSGGGGDELSDVAAVAEHLAAAGEDGDGVAKDALAETRDEALHRHRLLLGEPRGGGEDSTSAWMPRRR